MMLCCLFLRNNSMIFPSCQEVFDEASPGKQKETQEPDPTYEEKMVCSGTFIECLIRKLLIR